MDRYKKGDQKMLADGTAYPCYCTPEELDASCVKRSSAESSKETLAPWTGVRSQVNRYPPFTPRALAYPPCVSKSARWCGLPGKTASKGRVEFTNNRLDDFVIARSDGTPTTIFCVLKIGRLGYAHRTLFARVMIMSTTPASNQCAQSARVLPVRACVDDLGR
jgi:glutamyl-tRNA synthetase